MIKLIPLFLIDDNPYQTRSFYDETAIADLAESIRQLQPAREATRGLVHVPPARATGYRYQLAAGHSRLRAFRLLAKADPATWDAMPLDLVQLDDEAMADIIWQENVKRSDLTPADQAQALRLAIDKFGYTQAQVGERWGLSQGAVANKLRLLGLPAPALDALRRGEITERHGRLLLTALAKSTVVYERVAADVLPLPPPDPASAARARDLLTYRNGLHGWYADHTVQTDRQFMCAACGQQFPVAAWGGVHTTSRDGQVLYMCDVCYRVASDWHLPSVAESEEFMESAISQCSINLRDALWPLGEVVARGSHLIRNPICEQCTHRVHRDSDYNPRWLCLDRTCFDAKQQVWLAYLEVRLREALVDDGHPVVTIVDHDGSDLTSRAEGDMLLVRSGQCRACPRHRFRYYDAHRDTDSIRAAADLPWIYNCNNANSQRACSRKALLALRSEDEKAAEKVEQAAIKARQAEGHRRIAQAAAQVAQALLDHRLEPWQALARRIEPDSHSADKLTTVEQVAALLGNNLLRLYIHEPAWTESCDLEENLQFQLEQAGTILGLSLVPTCAQLQSRLNRLDFWLAKCEAGQPISPHILQHNRHNLDDYLAEASVASARGELSAADYHHLSTRIADLVARLDRISREIERKMNEVKQ